MSGGLLAYHNDPAIKAKYVGRMLIHQKADELIHNTYWKHGKGCAVGCTIHSDNHAAYETELGMPEWFAHLEDEIFEGMSATASRRFPLRLLSAVPIGFSDWDRLYHAFCAFLLRDVCMFDRTKYPDTASAVDAVICLHERWTETDDQAWAAALKAAWTVAQTAALLKARLAAWSAARSAARPAAQSVALPATWSVAQSAAQSAAWSAALTTQSAAAAQYDRMGDWLIDYFDVMEAAATDDDTEQGGNWEQQCSRYPDCDSSQAMVVGAGT